MKKFYTGVIFTLIAITIFATLPVVLNSVKAEDKAYDVWIFCNPETVVNVREKPSSSSSLVGRMECGMSVLTDGMTKKDNRGRTWLHLLDPLEVDESWICMDYISDIEVTVAEFNCVVTANGRVAARVKPDGKRKRWLSPGQEVTVLAYNGGWALTNKGYVDMRYLRGIE